MASVKEPPDYRVKDPKPLSDLRKSEEPKKLEVEEFIIRNEERKSPS